MSLPSAAQPTLGGMYLPWGLSCPCPFVDCCMRDFSSSMIRRGFVRRIVISSRYTDRPLVQSIWHVTERTHRLTRMSPPTPLAGLGNFATPAFGAIRIVVAKIITGQLASQLMRCLVGLTIARTSLRRTRSYRVFAPSLFSFQFLAVRVAAGWGAYGANGDASSGQHA